jgi:hypothetical protein
MIEERLGNAEELIARGEHKQGAQELYDAIFACRDVDDLRAIERVIDREVERAGWRHRGRYKELKRVVAKHLEKRGATVPV